MNGSSLIGLIIVLGLVFLIINLIRKKSQKTYSEDKLKTIDHSGYGDGKYFYQSPGMILDNQYIPIYGKKNLCHIPYYKDNSQKMRSMFGIKPLHGTQVRSDDHSVIIERIEGITNYALYRVLLDGNEIGTFKKIKCLKKAASNVYFRIVLSIKTRKDIILKILIDSILLSLKMNITMLFYPLNEQG